MTRAIVIGLGNPVLSDDAVGMAVAREVRQALGARGDVHVRELHVGGMTLMEACVGYERAFIVDAMTGGQRPGTVYRKDLRDLGEARACACAHDTSLATAFAIGRWLDLRLPDVVQVWGVEPANVNTFGETLTTEVGVAVPIVAGEIMAALGEAGGTS